jgi:hypothetical protein
VPTSTIVLDYCQVESNKILIDGYQMPLEFKSGLAYLCCRKPTDDELSSLPYVIMTSDVDCRPSTRLIDIFEIYLNSLPNWCCLYGGAHREFTHLSGRFSFVFRLYYIE